MTVKIFSAIMKGCCVVPVTITTTCKDGRGISISGLITETVHRDLTRVQYALLNCGFGYRRKKLHIDIEPAIYDCGETLMLAIATGILIATGNIISGVPIRNYLIIGGIGITGKIHEIDGAASMARMAKERGFKGVYFACFKYENRKPGLPECFMACP